MKPIFVQLPFLKGPEMKSGTVLGYVNLNFVSIAIEVPGYPHVSEIQVEGEPMLVDMPIKNLIDRIRTASA